MKQSNIPTICRDCWNFSGSYCDVHQHLIDDADNCSDWSPKSEDCSHWLNRLCTRSVYYEYCCGKDHCGAYEPKIDTRGTRNFDCHFYGGYTGCCYLKGGECTRKCKDFKTDNQYYDSLSESDLRISVAHLREVLEEMAPACNIPQFFIEDLIERVKKEI